MGGYKSLKRVLGETHLGRMLRWLFGVSLFALIFVAFFLVAWIGENLVMTNIHRNGREWVRYNLLDMHWESWDTNPCHKEFRKAFSQQLLPTQYQARTIANEQWLATLDPVVNQRGGKQRMWAPENEEEQQLIRKLKEDF